MRLSTKSFHAMCKLNLWSCKIGNATANIRRDTLMRSESDYGALGSPLRARRSCSALGHFILNQPTVTITPLIGSGG